MSAPLSQGQTLSHRFTLIERLGAGGMGEVWLVQDSRRAERVVLKLLDPQIAHTPAGVARLEQEYHQTRRLTHPHIVPVYELHRLDGCVGYTMRYLEGGDLGRHRGREAQALIPLLLPVVDALAYAHGMGVVHRDLKTGNVLCDHQGRPYVSDFGIAAALDTGTGRSGSSPGGSLYGMSPQQREGEAPQPSDDIYALGAMLFELLCGHPPFYPETDPARFGLAGVPALNPVHPLPEGLAELVTRMLAPTPEARPRDMALVGEELSGLAERPVVRPPSRPEIIPPPIEPPPPPPAPRPPTVTAPRSEDPRSAGPGRITRALIATALLLLFGVGLGVFLYLPEAVKEGRIPLTVDEDPGEPQRAIPRAGASRVPVSPRTRPTPRADTASEHRRLAQQALADLDQVQDALGEGVSAWGGQDYAQALEQIALGDRLFREPAYRTAAEAYVRAVRRLEALQDKKTRLLDSALGSARQALEVGDALEAMAQYRLALNIEPQLEEAVQGLARAEGLEQAMGRVRSALEHESMGELEQAQADFRQALVLDAQLEPAREGLARVAVRLEEARYMEAISAGLSALAGGDLDRAQQALDTARGLRPRTPELTDALSQLAQERQRITLARLRRQARALEDRERWQEAAALYDKVLAIDPKLVFARQGKARSLRWADISTRMAGYLKVPSRLSSRQVYASAKAFAEEASAMADKGPELSRQLATLEGQLKQAGKTVPVALESDNLTEVVVYRVGRLGRFLRRELRLRPGTYTAVGTRSGFRDVRRRFTVVADRTPAPVMVRCEERI
jgi:serine/threonine protein kinase/tetratricopeptide (TPR) repeat protein